MKRRLNKFFSILLVIAMILSMIPSAIFAATPSTLYVKPDSGWLSDGARLAAYFFGNGDTWASLSAVGNGYYSCSVPSGYSSVIICRMNGGSSDNNWDNKWNQSADLTLPTDGKNCITMNSGEWDGAGGSWGVYACITSGHSYSSKVTTAATCTAAGVKTYTCSRSGCGHSYTESIAATGHSYANATCTVAKKCSKCGATTGSALGHSYSYKATKNPTTSATGTLTGTCSRCSGTTTVTLPKLNTSDYTYTVTKAATCTATGTGSYKWKTTTYGSFTFTATIAATGHSYAAATCTSAQKCSKCGATTGSALGHNYSYKVTKSPTTSATGTLTGTCSRCSGTTTVTLPKLTTTNYTYTVTKAATCTATGTGRYTWKTTTYGTFYFDVSIAATGHSYAAATCTSAQKCSKCGATTGSALGHSYTSKVTTAATCTSNGVRTYTCSRCSGSYTEAISALGHSYTTKVTAPTCTAEGYTTHTCSTCGNSYKDTYTDATGHNYVAGTCASCGSKLDFYLFGFINGANHACEEDGSNLGSYKFSNGKLTVTFEYDSYVAVKTSDNAHWYMFKEYNNTTSGTLYNTADGGYEKMYIPGGVQVTFTVAAGSGDTLTLSYSVNASTCEHRYHNTSGKCTICGTAVSHSWSEGECSHCGLVCTHTWSGGKCSVCGTTCAHSWNSGTVTTAPTCTAAGIKTYTCSTCKSTKTESVSALGHSYGSASCTSAATCSTCGATTGSALGHSYTYKATKNPTTSATGTLTGTCSRCSGTTTVTLPKLTTTDYTYSVTKAPTCTAAGTGKYTWKTTTYGNYAFEVSIDATGHDYAAATCTKPKTCKTCGATTGSALGHSYTSKVTTAATCTANGVRTYTCSTCSNSYTEAIAATGHSYTTKVTAPTCTAEGYTTHTCSTCGDSYKDTYTDATGHNYVAGTCASCGSKLDFYLFGFINGANHACEEDGSNLGSYKFSNGKLTVTFASDSYVAVKTGDNAHWYMFKEYVNTTSGTLYNTADGGFEKMYVPGGIQVTFTVAAGTGDTLTLSYALNASSCQHLNHGTDGKCTACGASVSHSWSSGECTHCGLVCTHTWSGGKCSVCGTACSHSWNSGTVTTAPTCTAAGVKTFTCSTCKHTKTESVDATGHSYKAATCTAPKTCSVCGTTTGSALGHSYTSKVTTAPTCTAKGVKTFTCSTCSHSYTEAIDATGHSYTSKVTAPTCTAQGYTTHTCSVCSHSYQDTYTDAAGHDHVSGTCTVCGDKLDFYLFGFINGANYGCEEDHANLGEYKFIGGKLVATFTSDSYVAVKTSDNAHWYMFMTYINSASGTLYSTADGGSEKMFVPGGAEITFTLTPGQDDRLTLSFAITNCPHNYGEGTVTQAPTCTADGIRTYTCSICGNTKDEAVAATGHSYSAGACTVCGVKQTYYLFGFINGANYACEEDRENLGQYKFVDGKLTATFTSDSYVAVKTGDNQNWYMFMSYVSSASGTLYNTNAGATEKMFVPGGAEITFTLVHGSDDRMTLSYAITNCSHNYGEGTVTQAPTCTENGIRTYTCSICGGVKTEAITAPGHSYTSKVTAPTCTAGGYTTYTCSTCGHSYKDSETSALGHSYTKKVTAPTCTTGGYTVYTCSTCQHSYQGDETAALGHDHIAGTCSVCGNKLDFYLYGFINGADHAYGEDGGNLGDYKFIGGKLTVSFTTDSYIGIKTSDNLNWYMTENYVDTASATFYNTNTGVSEKMFIPGGIEVVFTLTVGQGDSLNLSYTISSCSHNYGEGQVTQAPTCTADGVRSYTCSLCGNVKTETVKATGHSYTGKVTAPTCTAGGYTTYTCSACGHSYQGDETAALGHNYVGGTCNACGSKLDYYLFGFINGANYACEEDRENLGQYKFVGGKLTVTFDSDSYIAVKASDNAHWYMFQTYHESTFGTLHNTSTGASEKMFVPGGAELVFTLEVYDDDTLSLSYVIASCSHNYGEGQITTAPTCISEGVRTYTCSICGDVKTETVEALSHSYTSQVTAPTCTAEGYTTYTCSACGHSYKDDHVSATGHDHIAGKCTVCGDQLDFYLYGFINGADYAYGEDGGNLGEYKFVDGKLTVNFTADSYIGIKTGNNLNWYMTETYVDTASATFYNTNTGASEKMFIPGGIEVIFTLTVGEGDSLELSYVISSCSHNYGEGTVTAAPTCTENGTRTYTCSLCGNVKTETIQAIGHSYTSAVTAPTCTEGGYTTYTCSVCDHSYQGDETAALGHDHIAGKCTVCGDQLDFYLYGFINGADYAYGEDGGNLGEYKFVDGKLTVSFTSDSYIGIKTGNNLNWYMTETYVDTASATFYNTNTGASEKMFIPGGIEVVFTLTVGEGDSLELSYVIASCSHNYGEGTVTEAPTCTTDGVRTYTCSLCGDVKTETVKAPGHTYEAVVTAPTCTEGGYTTYTCSACDHSYTGNETAALDHNYVDGTCTNCGEAAPIVDYYLFGFINGGNYGCEEDFENLGQFKFVNGSLVATFDSDSYIAVKTGDNLNWYMFQEYTDTASGTLYSTSTGAVEKMFVPGNVEITFTLVVNADGSLTLSYVAAECEHSYEAVVTAPTCTEGGYTTYTCACGDTYTADETAALGHNYVDGVCGTCGASDGSQITVDYYLFGFINGGNYGCEEDYENLGEFKFVDGSLVATFDSDSYIAIKTGDNLNWYMFQEYNDTTSGTLYSTSTGAVEKMFVPGNVEITFTLVVNADGSLTLSYVAAECEHSYEAVVTAPNCQSGGYTTYTCTICGHSYVGDETPTAHDYHAVSGFCMTCGVLNPDVTLYLTGVINGVSYNKEIVDADPDAENLIRFDRNGVLNITLTEAIENLHVYCYHKDGTGAVLSYSDYSSYTAAGDVTFWATPATSPDSNLNLDWHVHEWDEGVVITEGDCTTPAVKKYTCSGTTMDGITCTSTKEVETAAPGHSYTSTVTAPTCTADGYTTYTCGVCGHSYTDDVIAAPGHNYVSGTCSNCGATEDSGITSGVVVHLVNTLGWEGVSGYFWTGTSTALSGWGWPGKIIDRDENGYFTVHLDYEPTAGQSLNLLFQNFNGGQTADVSVSYETLSQRREIWVKPSTTANTDGKYDCTVSATESGLVISPEVDGTQVTFRYQGSASSVALAGSMNGWGSTAMVKGADGVWSLTLTLEPGVYEYKFVVDGNWITDPYNGVVGGYDGNSIAVVPGTSSVSGNQIKVVLHFYRASGDYTGWDVWFWDNSSSGAVNFTADTQNKGMTATFTVDGSTSDSLGYVVRKSDWSDQEFYDRFIDLSYVKSGTVHYYLNSGSASGSLVYGNDVVSEANGQYANLDYESGNVWFKTSLPVANVSAGMFSIVDANGAATGISVTGVTLSGNGYTLTLSSRMTLTQAKSYQVKFNGTLSPISYNAHDLFYSSTFNSEYNYTGDDLGANWSYGSTTFKVWAPTAKGVSVILFNSGNYGTASYSTVAMTQGSKGVWSVTVSGNLHGKYYNYLVDFGSYTVEATDPYAKAVGANGDRGMVINMNATDPAGWDNDVSPNKGMSYTDAIIYEMHVREFTIDSNSGVTYKGTYLGLAEDGTSYNGYATALDHLKELGVTHVQLMPVYDYNSVDEYHLTDWQQYAWGYDPKNYNVPEGSYSTDPYNGDVRISEFKEMVQTFHENGINVVMDVVYNHAFDGGNFCYNKIVPNYFSRFYGEGNWSNGSGVGNDFATERVMARNFIVDSIMHWVEEYHIDGFRFDLAGLIDTQTINEIVNTVHAKYPYVMFYGEGWAPGDTAVEYGYDLATKGNAWQTSGFGYFNDTFRNAIAGDNGSSWGFATGSWDYADTIANAFRASNGWSSSPTQTINYASCHDNYSLMDKIILSRNGAYWEEMVRMNNLSAALYMMAQGVPFIYSGEELLREKKDAAGNRYDNAYGTDDYVNKINWADLANKQYASTTNDYYAGLIEFRKNHAALRNANGADAWNYVTYHKLSDQTILFYISGYPNYECSDGIVIIYNASSSAQQVNLGNYIPSGYWQACVHGTQAGTTPLWGVDVSSGSGTIGVEGISTTILVLGDLIDETSVYNSQASNCSHSSHNTSGMCTSCGKTVDHSYSGGKCSVCGLSQSAPSTYTVYFEDVDGWNNVNVYAWTKTAGTTKEYTGSWPGSAMTLVDEANGIYAYELPVGATNLIFSGSGSQSSDLAAPGYTSEAVLYSGGSWTTYTPACTHSYSDTVVVPGDCVTDGEVLHTCTLCGYSYTEIIQAPGHIYESVVTAPTCTTQGYTTHTCTGCGKTYTDSYVDALRHNYVDGTCDVCGTVKAYYLFGYINGANYACEEDRDNMGEYKFADGSLVVVFEQDSYVAVKTTDNEDWFMTDGYQEGVTSVTLYNTNVGITAEKLFVPSGMEVTFTLTENEDGTLTLSYFADTSTCQHSYDEIYHPATCQQYASYEYICGRCGDSYREEVSAWTDWSTEVPAEGKTFETKTEYRYSDYQTQTSYATSLPGYTLLSSIWEQTGNATISYVDSWPSGFLTTSSNYILYNNKANKVTASETETDKTVINSDAVVGYLYYHWCYADSYYSVASKSGSYTTFHSYFNTTMDYDKHDSSDGSYRNANADCCSNSDWYWIIPVYGQNYTTYRKQFTYERWTDWSAWSDTAVEATDTRKVETRTLYRYLDGDLGKHSFANGVCTVCGEINTCTHDYEGVITAPTCTAPGFTTYSCGLCGESYVGDETPATGHTFVDGKCEICGEADPDHCFHTYEPTVTAPTCTDGGYTTYTCTACGESYIDDVTDALGHSYVDGKCEVCGAEEEIPCEHVYESVITDPTCTEPGYTTYTCSACGDSYVGDETEATGHSYVDGACEHCGAVDPAVCEHTYEGVTTDPTCTESGYTTYTCGLCGHSYVGDETEALGHTFVDGKCEICGAIDPSVCEHTYESTVTAPTCTESGYTTYTCGLCGHSYVGDEVEAVGHTFVDGKCEICGAEEETECQHTYESVVTAPTCTEPGYTTYTCSACGDSYVGDETEATGHSYVDGKCEHCGEADPNGCQHVYESAVIAGTCTTNGCTRYTCTLCGHSYEENVVEAPGHSYSDGRCTVCRDPKPLSTDYYLVGWINGANYGCEDDAANMGIYKFENNVLKATFNEGSYVFVKTAGNENWYMCDGYPGDGVCSANLYNTSLPINHDKVNVPGAVEITFTLIERDDGSLTMTYVKAGACPHDYYSYTSWWPGCTTTGEETYRCILCADTYTKTLPANGHNYSGAYCTSCGAENPYYTPTYYLFGYINGGNYACEENVNDTGIYKFVNGKLTATFESDSYVAVKTGDNAKWFMTDGFQEGATSVTLYNTNTGIQAEKLYVPGGRPVTFTLRTNSNGTLTLSYTLGACSHEFGSYVSTQPGCTTAGVRTYYCNKCDYTYDESIAATGHNYVDGICGGCGSVSGDYVENFYLFGYINGANYGCEEDAANMGSYKFVNGKLTATFNSDSYIAVKTSGNLKWYMAQAYIDTSSGTFYNTSTGAVEKMFVPGGVELVFTLTVNEDDTLTLSYVDSSACDHSYTGAVTAEPNCSNEGVMTYTCELCGHSYTESIPTNDKHSYVDGACEHCGITCQHSYVDGTCEHCGMACQHSYIDGVCEHCGAADPDYTVPTNVTVSAKYPGLAFKDEIYYNIYFDISNPDNEEIVEMGLITWTSPVDGDITNAEYICPGAVLEGDFWKTRSQAISAKNMGEELYFKVYVKLSTGTYAYSVMRSYSAKSYCESKLATSNDAQLKALCVALMNYGAAAQEYFGYKTDELMNAGLTEEQKALAAPYTDEMIPTLMDIGTKGDALANNDGYTKRYPHVTFGGALAINYNFMPANTPANGMKLYVWTQADAAQLDELTLENASQVIDMTETDGLYTGKISDIAAKNAGDTYFVCGVYQVETEVEVEVEGEITTEIQVETYYTGVLAYSVSTYCKSYADLEGDAFQPMASTAAVYTYYASIYLNK